MVRITLVETSSEKTRMKIEGRIVSDWIKTVDAECQQLLTQGRKVLLDLSGVIFIEADGASMIRALLEKGCVLWSCPLFIHHVLFTQSLEGGGRDERCNG